MYKEALGIMLIIFILLGCTLATPSETPELSIVANDTSPPPVTVSNETPPKETLQNPTPETATAPIQAETTEKNTMREEQSIIETPLSPEEKVWKQRIDAAIGSSDCPTVVGPTYGNSYYTGPLIDSHYHIPTIPGDSPLETDEDDEEDEDEDEIDVFIFPSLGENLKINDIVCTLEQEGTKKVFAFFPVYPEIPKQMAEVAYRTMQLYPERFVPFIMPPDSDDNPKGFPTVSADVLEKMLNLYPDLFKGYGEIGLYEREDGAAELPPDSQRLLAIYPVVREHQLAVYFHLGKGHKSSFERMLRLNPNINFIWHGDQLSVDEIEDVIGRNPNVFYTIDELYGDKWMIRSDKTKEEFLEYLKDYEYLLRKDVSTWKDVIERHPDQFMWGTDRSDQVLWSHYPEVGQALANYGRAFIARLKPEVQEKFAYKNAERLLQSNPVS